MRARTIPPSVCGLLATELRSMGPCLRPRCNLTDLFALFLASCTNQTAKLYKKERDRCRAISFDVAEVLMTQWTSICMTKSCWLLCWRLKQSYSMKMPCNRWWRTPSPSPLLSLANIWWTKSHDIN